MRYRILIMALDICLFAPLAIAQGEIIFANRDLALGIDARVTFASSGLPVGEGFTAQLFAGPPGAPVDSLRPTLPTTTFRTEPPGALGYINNITVRLPDIQYGAFATFVMRAFDGPTWEESLFRGESLPVTVQTRVEFPAYLEGLHPFQVALVPEPEAWIIIFSGVGFFICTRRKR